MPETNHIKQFNVLVLFFIAMSNTRAELPEGFVYLNTINPSIIENLRYYTDENFLGHPMVGYNSNRVILSQPSAEALSKVQGELNKDGYSLVVYDGYRPQKTVDSFIRWSKDPADQVAKAKYYPSIDKAKVFDLGFVAKKSGHSRGSTVDLTIISLNNSLHTVEEKRRWLENGEHIFYLDDGTVDMGSSYDLFNEASHHDTALVGAVFTRMRNYLKGIMQRNGFAEYKKEWWHYTLKGEPFPSTYFDFDIQ